MTVAARTTRANQGLPGTTADNYPAIHQFGSIESSSGFLRARDHSPRWKKMSAQPYRSLGSEQ
jgi:hypothetical protein